MKTWERSWKFILSALGMVVLVLMVMDFNGRMAELRRLTSEKAVMGKQATQLSQTNVYLETQIAYATSDQAVDKYAREEQHMQKLGDNPVVPMAPANSTPIPTPYPVVTPKVINNWDLWMGLFFDKTVP
jgi:cell division protein FtsB